MNYRLAALWVCAFTALTASADPSPAKSPAADRPAIDAMFTSDGRLKSPSDYREWIFLTSGLDMNYSDRASGMGHSTFDNVFVDPVSYRVFRQTGRWPDGTRFVKEGREAGEKGSINKHGKFQVGEPMALEVHVKDSKRFAGGWAFYVFSSVRSEPAQQIPRSASCYSCHEQHGAVDTTFVQFYPTLLGIATQKRTLSPTYRP